MQLSWKFSRLVISPHLKLFLGTFRRQRQAGVWKWGTTANVNSWHVLAGEKFKSLWTCTKIWCLCNVSQNWTLYFPNGTEAINCTPIRKYKFYVRLTLYQHLSEDMFIDRFLWYIFVGKFTWKCKSWHHHNSQVWLWLWYWRWWDWSQWGQHHCDWSHCRVSFHSPNNNLSSIL